MSQTSGEDCIIQQKDESKHEFWEIEVGNRIEQEFVRVSASD